MRRASAMGSALVGALVLGLGACGGDDPTSATCPAGTTGSPPNCQPTPPPCRQTPLDQAAEPIEENTLIYFDFSVPETGRLDMTLDWTYPDSPMGLYLVPANTCTLDEFNARSCNFLVRSEPSLVKPRKVSQANFSAGNYRWIVGNFRDEPESFTLQVGLSIGASCPALALPLSASDATSDALPAIQRAVPR